MNDTGVELLIKAHECFTASCNVEGIGKVLRRARMVASIALQEEKWQYLVKQTSYLFLIFTNFTNACLYFKFKKLCVRRKVP